MKTLVVMSIALALSAEVSVERDVQERRIASAERVLKERGAALTPEQLSIVRLHIDALKAELAGDDRGQITMSGIA